MRQITKEIQVYIDGSPLGFRLTKPDAFPASRCCGCVPVTYPYVDGLLFLPAAAGMWKQHGFRDGTCTLDDLPDFTGLIRVRRENEKRAADAAQGSDLFFRVFLPAGPDKPECIILIILRNNFYSNTAVLKLTPLPD